MAVKAEKPVILSSTSSEKTVHLQMDQWYSHHMMNSVRHSLSINDNEQHHYNSQILTLLSSTQNGTELGNE